MHLCVLRVRGQPTFRGRFSPTECFSDQPRLTWQEFYLRCISATHAPMEPCSYGEINARSPQEVPFLLALNHGLLGVPGNSLRALDERNSSSGAATWGPSCLGSPKEALCLTQPAAWDLPGKCYSQQQHPFCCVTSFPAWRPWYGPALESEASPAHPW